MRVDGAEKGVSEKGNNYTIGPYPNTIGSVLEHGRSCIRTLYRLYLNTIEIIL